MIRRSKVFFAALVVLVLGIARAQTIDPTPPPGGTVGIAYTTTITASGGTGPYTFGISGSLPPGISQVGNSGTLSGTPTQGGSFPFTVTATDSKMTSGSPRMLTIPIDLSVSPSSLPGGTAGTVYPSQVLTANGATGSPVSWSVSSGALPTGLTQSGGTISGTPTVAGTFNFTVQALDNGTLGSGATGSKSYSISVAVGITTSSLPAGTVNTAYSQGLSETGATGAVTWSISSGPLPTGLAISGSNITGTPTAAGTFNFTVQAFDAGSGATGSKALSIVINLSLGPSSLPNGAVGSAYLQMLTATGAAGPFTWTVLTGSLPSGLTLNSSTGAITGTPLAPAGISNFTVQASGSGAVGSKSYSITIASALIITTAPTLPSGVINTVYSPVTLSATGGTSPYSWSIISGSPPAGLNLNGTTGTISGTPTGSGTFNFTVQVTDSASVSVSKAFSIQILAGLSITTAPTLPGGAVGVAYSQTLSAAGGTAPYTWSITAGSLPGGLILNSSSGAITGTPTASGSFGFTVQVADSASGSTTKAFSLTIAAALIISNAPALPGGTVGLAYSQTLTATGGTAPYAWSITAGSLPAGLSLNAGTGSISGTPTTVGSFGFTATVTDSASVSVSKAFTLSVINGLTIVTAPALPSGTVGGSYTVTLQASGGTPPYSWSIIVGSPPPGITIDAATGTLSGGTSSSGTFNFTVQVTDSASLFAIKAFSIAISAGLTISTAPILPAGALSVAYSQTLVAVGGTQPYSWSVNSGQLPAGLGLNPGTGVISGTPTSAGDFSFTVHVTDSASASSSKQFSLTVVGGLTITTAPALADGTIGAAYSQALTAAGGTAPYTWSITAGSLPPGLAINATSGLLTGKPTTVGTSTFTATVTDSASASVGKQFTLKINSDLTITTPLPLPDGALGKAYSVTLAASGGKSPYGWSVKSGSLPPGISFSSVGVLAGQPTSTGDFSFTVQVTDNLGATFTKDFAIHVSASALPNVTIGGLPDNVDAGQQSVLSITLASAYPSKITGEMTLAFQPDAAAPADDPALQFSTGGRSATFNIPANTTQAIFTASQLALQTGTIAGTITVTISLQPAGNSQPVTLTRTVKIARAAPSIRTVTLVTTASGFEVHILGWSTPRDMSSAVVHFTPAAGGNLQTTTLTVSLTSVAQTWFADAQSAQFGSQYTLVLPFTVTGPATAVASVSVQLTNSAGTSSSGSANF